jgi:hypothetical protein
MNTNILDAAAALSDGALLARIDALAGSERETTAELVAHLAALENRPSAHAARGYGTLFDYCTQALGLSEDAACNRIGAARACRQFPVVLELLANGSITLTTIRILQPHLTPQNHAAVLARAASQKRGEIERLAAELNPKPDVASSVRKLPTRAESAPWPVVESRSADGDGSPSIANDCLSAMVTVPGPGESPAPMVTDTAGEPSRPGPRAPSATKTASERPLVKALSPSRYRVQFTMGQDAHDDLRCVQDLLRREIPSGDAGLIFERALALLRQTVERKKLGGKAKAGSATRTEETRAVLQPASGTEPRAQANGPTSPPFAGGIIRRAADGPTRHVPKAVQRAVWWRDRGQCAFASADGHRCTARTFLELHHIRPYALDGPPTTDNIALRCRRHNQYEAELVFGRRAIEVRGPDDGESKPGSRSEEQTGRLTATKTCVGSDDACVRRDLVPTTRHRHII